MALLTTSFLVKGFGAALMYTTPQELSSVALLDSCRSPILSSRRDPGLMRMPYLLQGAYGRAGEGQPRLLLP